MIRYSFSTHPSLICVQSPDRRVIHSNRLIMSDLFISLENPEFHKLGGQGRSSSGAVLCPSFRALGNSFEALY